MTKDDDVFAARVARSMWRMAKRRAGLDAEFAKEAPISPQDGRGQSLDTGAEPRMQRGAHSHGARQGKLQGPGNLQEFLQELALELEEDVPKEGGAQSVEASGNCSQSLRTPAKPEKKDRSR